MKSEMNWDKNREYRADRKKRAIRVFRNVEVLREKANITKQDLSELLDCPASVYSNWSVGRFVPQDYEAVLNKLSDIFGIPVDDLENPDFKADEINTIQIIETKHKDEEVVNATVEDDENVIFQSAIERKKLEIQNRIKELQLEQHELLEKLKKLEEFEGLMF
jgi:transcriptional regulator with XRE-family HTH domain